METSWVWFLLLCLAGAALMPLWLGALRVKRVGGGECSDLPLRLVMLLAPFCMGLFYVWSCALCNLILLGELLFVIVRRGRLRLVWDEGLLMLLLLFAAYALSALWATERGLAPMGAVKALTPLLFALCLQQFDGETRTRVLDTLPLSGAVMTLLSAALCAVPACRDWLLVDGRLAGFFQYPNTFALFLLLGLVVAVSRGRWRRDLPLALVLAAGLVSTGSRTALVLAALIALLWALRAGNARRRALLLGALALCAAALVGAALLFPDTPVGRVLMISVSSSSLLGRLLYFRDALPVILRHPFGLGYMGYYYSQGSFQTGVYSVMFVHNELLQLLLDVGWLPALAAAAVLGRRLLRRGTPWRERMLLLAILGHCMLDFDLQFAVIWFVVAATLGDGKRFGESTLRRRGLAAGAATVLAALGVSLGASDGMSAQPQAALVLYPNNTDALYQSLLEAQDTETMDALAARTLALDEHVSVAHSARALVAFQQGDIQSFIEEKEEAISCSPYTQEEYQDYFNKLTVAISLYKQQGDSYSVTYCVARLRNIPDQMQQALDAASPLAWRIVHKPELALTEEQLAYLDALED